MAIADMSLELYNTLTRKKSPLEFIEPEHARMYVCGMTVYDYCHVGHARVMVVFDLLARYLRWSGLRVTYVRNITDIDDKIIKRAQENGEPMAELTARFIGAMHEDSDRLGVLPPDQEPRATEHMHGILDMIGRLEANGYAYAGANGDVFYEVGRFDGYGKLSGKKTEDLISGSRVAVEEAKRDPLDFVLWKRAKEGEPAWDSKWGSGRPGWHIECSAMSTACLGNSFDIHGGGGDLVFPHHENEIAQSEAATGEPFVHTWMHVGYVQINEEKMSKSLGNFFTIREVLEKYPAEVVRYFLISSHYRSPLNYSEENLQSAWGALERLYSSLVNVEIAAEETSDKDEWVGRFQTAMDDDLNTPEAMAVLFDLVRELNRVRETDPALAGRLAATLKSLGTVLGILGQDPETFLQTGAADQLDADAIEDLIRRRNQARADKDWAEADRVRDLLAEAGVQLLDSREGTSWRRG